MPCNEEAFIDPDLNHYRAAEYIINWNLENERGGNNRHHALIDGMLFDSDSDYDFSTTDDDGDVEDEETSLTSVEYSGIGFNDELDSEEVNNGRIQRQPEIENSDNSTSEEEDNVDQDRLILLTTKRVVKKSKRIQITRTLISMAFRICKSLITFTFSIIYQQIKCFSCKSRFKVI